MPRRWFATANPQPLRDVEVSHDKASVLDLSFVPGVATGVAALAVGAFLSVAPLSSTSAQEPPQPPSPPPLAPAEGQGAQLYLRDCAWCHGTSIEGTARGPTLAGTGEASNHFYLTTGRMPIADPADPIRRRPPVYSPEEITAIVDHVVRLGGGPASPAVDPQAGDLGQGGELYRLHCGQCHGATGAGFPLLSGRTSPPMWHATAREVAESIRIGPGGMPVFSRETLSDQEVNAVVRYVLYLQEPDDRGGYHLFRVGPLTEGMVAWLIGIVALLVAARLLGERT